MKKLISIFLIIVIILALFIGCDSNEVSSKHTNTTSIGYTLPQSAVYEYEIENKETGKKETRSYLIDLLNDRYDKNVDELYIDETCNERAVITKEMPKTIYREDGWKITKLTYVETIYTTIYAVGNSVDIEVPVYDTAKNELLGYRHKLETGYGNTDFTWFEYV